MTETKPIKCISQYEVVNVVGNARSLLSQNYGKEIDKHPTIRFNYLEKLDAQHQGTRWDIVASSQVKLLNHYKNPLFHTLLWTRWNKTDDKNLPALLFDINRIEVPFETMQLISRTTKRPTTGLTALLYLETIGVKCNLFGFDFKATPTFYNSEAEEKRGNGPHDFELEKRVIIRTVEQNNWNIFL